QRPRRPAPVANPAVFGDRGDDGERCPRGRAANARPLFRGTFLPMRLFVHGFINSGRIARWHLGDNSLTIRGRFAAVEPADEFCPGLFLSTSAFLHDVLNAANPPGGHVFRPWRKMNRPAPAIKPAPNKLRGLGISPKINRLNKVAQSSAV